MKTEKIIKCWIADQDDKIAQSSFMGNMINKKLRGKQYDVDALYKAEVEKLMEYSKEDLITMLSMSDIVVHAIARKDLWNLTD